MLKTRAHTKCDTKARIVSNHVICRFDRAKGKANVQKLITPQMSI